MANINETYARDLDLNLLRVFVVVAEEGSLTRAASRLYVTQPAMSAAMRRLATFVGAELIVRQGRGVAVTARGAELLAAARAHLQPLVAAATATPVFDPKTSTARIRFGLADGLEAVILPRLIARLQREAPRLQLIVLGVQFRTIEEKLLTNQIDFAVTVADDLPQSILRQPLRIQHAGSPGFVCLFDSRFTRLGRTLNERQYFEQEHVIVSYAGDTRGIIEDVLGKTRSVRVSVPAFGYIADVVDGSSLVATVPSLLARELSKTRPHLRALPLPFSMESTSLDLLWSRVTDADPAARFVREQVASIVESPAVRAPKRERRERQTAGKTGARAPSLSSRQGRRVTRSVS